MKNGTLIDQFRLITASLILGAAATISQAQAADVKEIYSTELSAMQTPLLSALTVTYGPGEGSKPHRHGAAAFVYVLDGAIRSQVGENEARIYRPGDSWFEEASERHGVSENALSDAPSTMLVIFIGNHDNHQTTYENESDHK